MLLLLTIEIVSQRVVVIFNPLMGVSSWRATARASGAGVSLTIISFTVSFSLTNVFSAGVG